MSIYFGGAQLFQQLRVFPPLPGNSISGGSARGNQGSQTVVKIDGRMRRPWASTLRAPRVAQGLGSPPTGDETHAPGAGCPWGWGAPGEAQRTGGGWKPLAFTLPWPRPLGHRGRGSPPPPPIQLAEVVSENRGGGFKGRSVGWSPQDQTEQCFSWGGQPGFQHPSSPPSAGRDSAARPFVLGRTDAAAGMTPAAPPAQGRPQPRRSPRLDRPPL